MTSRKGYADEPDGQVHYRDAVAGTPLLLLHQTPCHLGMFDAAWELLVRAGIRAIGIDTPGYGQSDPTRDPPTIAAYARAVAAVLDHLQLEASGRATAPPSPTTSWTNNPAPGPRPSPASWALRARVTPAICRLRNVRAAPRPATIPGAAHQ